MYNKEITMVKQTLSNFRKQLKRNHVTAFLLHYHVHIDEEVECENVIILEKAEAKDVFRILNQYSIYLWTNARWRLQRRVLRVRHTRM